ncbi:hypothetical protein ABEB36_012605 [Hypothenemus hampei]|uniref:RING-type domain-containing protein n=1 Tax=Hypothenemus hampei TaxID=57062 RepID=A0ABD1ECG8_HYPHA
MDNNCQQWKLSSMCAVCCRALDRLPVFHCSQNHPCCQHCFKDFKMSKGNESLMNCPLCKNISYEQTKIKPGIGRPYRYNMNMLPATKYHCSKNYQDCYANPSTQSTSAINNEDEEKVFEMLIGISKRKFYQNQSTDKKSNRVSTKSKFTLPPSSSKRPFQCPHKPCHKTVAIAQLVNHFKSEHKDVLNFSMERGKELLIPCDVTLIEHNFSFCLAMITIYEINRIDFLKRGSSESIVRTCNKFCQKVPISTFWLMVSGSSDRKSTSAYCLFWLFTNSEDLHKCTLELSSKEDSISLSSFCEVSKVLEKDFGIFKKLQGLIVTRSSLRALLRDGISLNLRVTVH